MLQVKNPTQFPATILLSPDPSGIESVFAVAKCTFTIEPDVRVAPEQVPLAKVDAYYGDPTASSIKAPSDLTLIKPGTDVLLLGDAWAPNGKPVATTNVSLSVGPIQKSVRVFGDRIWESSGFFGGVRITPPAPFEQIPLRWERAFGGIDESQADPKTVEVERRNPVGVGYRMKKSEKPLDGLKLPNFEEPAHPITSWKQRPVPTNFGPIGPVWEPKLSYAGTYDQAWQQTRAPYLPEDFDSRFFQSAPQDQIVEGYLKGGESVTITGVSPKGPLRFALPRYAVHVTYILDDQKVVKPANLDTVVIDAGHSRLMMSWRTVLPCDKKSFRVREICFRIAQAS